MSKKEYIDFWLLQSEDDWIAVDMLFKGSKYLQALFFAHLVIEKICKSIWIKYNSTNVPPRTHNLIHLLSFTPLVLDEQQSELLLKLNRFQLEGRYPEYITKMYNICDKQFTTELLLQTNNLRLWLLEKVQ